MQKSAPERASACCRASWCRSIGAPPTGCSVSRHSRPISMAHQRKRVEPRVARAHLAFRLRLLDQPGDQADRLADDEIVVDLGQLGEIARFADHDLGHRADRHGAGDLGEAGQQDADDLGERQVGRFDRLPDRGDIGRHCVAHDRAEQVLLVLEIEVERALRDPRRAWRFRPAWRRRSPSRRKPRAPPRKSRVAALRPCVATGAVPSPLLTDRSVIYWWSESASHDVATRLSRICRCLARRPRRRASRRRLS